MIDTILQGDALTRLLELESESVQCCVTSPPYWGLRDYKCDGQLGHEPTPDAYVAALVAMFHEVKRVLRNDGTLWLVIGDSYCGSWGNYRAQNRGAGRQRQIVNGSQVPNPAYDGSENWRPPTADIPGLKSKDLVGIPWMTAFALRADGWYLRSEIIWAKPGPMPESVTDRPTKSHEQLFLLTKSERYYYDAEAIKEPSNPASNLKWERNGPCSAVIVPGQSHAQHRKDRVVPINGIGSGRHGDQERLPIRSRPSVKRGGFNGKTNELKGREAFRAITETRNKRDVWTVPFEPNHEAHFAMFPSKLIEPCILAGAPRGGVVLDPFMGSGTTALECIRLQRHYLGIELNADNVSMSKRRIADLNGPLFTLEDTSP
jgi:DNA modification methylase